MPRNLFRSSSRIVGRSIRSAQRGISLVFALMALVILGLAAVALTRSVDTGTMIMGNLSFKQDALVASSSGAEQAMAWLSARVAEPTLPLNSDASAQGYYASAIDRLDVTGNQTSTSNKRPLVDWDDNNCNYATSGTFSTCAVDPAEGAAVNGNRVRWVITRLCDQVGAPSATNLCVRPATSATSSAAERGELQPGGRISGGIASPYYRIVVRVDGPRNTVSYTESLVHF